jgi:hypothetical protein
VNSLDADGLDGLPAICQKVVEPPGGNPDTVLEAGIPSGLNIHPSAFFAVEVLRLGLTAYLPSATV